MTFKYSLAAAVMLATVSVVFAEEAPVDAHDIPANRNQASVTKHYLRKRQATSDIALTSVYSDVLYTVPMTLGTPPQKFNLAIDTGSYITWVVSTSCITGACANITNHFNPALSSTNQLTANPFAAQYVSGDRVAGQYMTEQYGIGNLNFQAIAGLVTLNEASLPPTVDGIMGLWSTAPDNSPILKVLATTKALAKNEIGVWLQANSPVTQVSNRGNAPGGEITFGGANPTRYQGDIVYVNCVGNTPWMLPVGELSVNGRKIPTGNAQATIDTGTSLMVIPKTIADAIHTSIPGSVHSTEYGWFVPCEGNIPITIKFGNFAVTIPYKSFAIQDNWGRLNTGQVVCLSSAMYPMGDTVAVQDWLLGAVFLKNVYSIYDFDPALPKGRIGFAQLAVGGNEGTGPIGNVNPGNGNNNGGNNNGGNNNGGNNNNNGNHGPSGAVSLQTTSGTHAFRVLVVAVAGAAAAMLL
ncbi:hypothetical protein FBU30_003129 [Linnemannia zychae]|nr:hypothetical protein FBU30_003129 [Linnemannia zychae]